MTIKRLSILSILLVSLQLLPETLYAERFDYNLYISAGFINMNIGQGCLRSYSAAYESVPAQTFQLTLTSSQHTDRLYQLRDTITSVNNLDGDGLFYCKVTNQNNRHDRETAHFSREGELFQVSLYAYALDGALLDQGDGIDSRRIYDMLSMLQFTRSLDSHDINPGYTICLPMVNGTMVVEQYIVFEGIKTIKADDGKSYSCLVLSVRDRKYGKERETLKTYVTSDSLHKPVQLEIKLGMGCIKARLK